MGLFDRFSDTIFLKEDSELEKEIAELKSIRDNVKEKDKIDLDIKKLELGLYGEKQIEYELKSSDLGMYVLHDITLEYEDLTAQIDYMLFTPSATYIVECKNLIGDITIDNKGEFVREYVINGKKIKESIYSPYRQAQRHIEIMKKMWLKKQNKLTVFLFEKNYANWYKPLVVFANPKGILNMKYAPKEIKENVIRIDQLNEYLKKEKNKLKWEDLYTEKQNKEYAEAWLERNIERKRDFSNKYSFISDGELLNKLEVVSEKDVLQLENALREFRTNKSKDKNLPAYYIFNNDELTKLLDKMPTSYEELLNANILDPIKLKLHGQEIVDIINKYKK